MHCCLSILGSYGNNFKEYWAHAGTYCMHGRCQVGAHFFVLKFKTLVSSLSLGKKPKKKLFKK